MQTKWIGAMVLGMMIVAAPASWAQTQPQPQTSEVEQPLKIFVEGGIMTERDSTETSVGSGGSGGRAVVGFPITDRSNLRVEIDVPHWRRAGPLEVRTISYGMVFAHRLAEIGRVRPALVAGAGIEDRHTRWSGVDSSHNTLSAIVGIDAEIPLTSNLSLTPEFRFHTFPYPYVSIVRPDVVLRWQF